MVVWTFAMYTSNGRIPDAKVLINSISVRRDGENSSGLYTYW